jgi:hypothetical protein
MPTSPSSHVEGLDPAVERVILRWAMRHSVARPMWILFLLVLLRFVLRNSWVALAALVAIQTVLSLPFSSEYVWIHVVANVVGWTLGGLVLMRFGLVATLPAYFIAVEPMGDQPLTLDFSTWYAGGSLVALLAGVAVTIYGCYASLAGRSLWEEELAEG